MQIDSCQVKSSVVIRLERMVGILSKESLENLLFQLDGIFRISLRDSSIDDGPLMRFRLAADEMSH